MATAWSNRRLRAMFVARRQAEVNEDTACERAASDSLQHKPGFGNYRYMNRKTAGDTPKPLIRKDYPALASLVLVVGCLDAHNTESVESDIYRDGSDWAADQGTHPQVVRIVSPTAACTGWLSSSNTITTNAHCLASTAPAAMVGWTYDPTMANSNPSQYAALIAMGASTGGIIHPGGGGCPGSIPDCCWGADMAVLTFPNPMPRSVMRPLRLIAAQAAEPECSGSDTCITVIGTGRTNGDVCLDANASSAALDPSATQLFVESGLGDGHCSANGNMLYGEYDFDDSSICKGDSGSPILWRSGELMAQTRGTGGDGGDDVVGPVLWVGGPNTARDFYVSNAADQDGDAIQAFDDNCDRTANPLQADWNADSVGDACQDSDGDGLLDDVELRTGTAPGRADSDGDGFPDGVTPPPPPAPTNCRQFPPGTGGCDMTNIVCDPLPPRATISVPGFMTEVDDAAHGKLHVTYVSSQETTIDVSVCARNIGGESCSSAFPIVLSEQCRGGWVPEEYRCPWGEVRCQGSCKPLRQCKFLE